MADEPLVKRGLRTFELRKWELREGRMTITLNASKTIHSEGNLGSAILGLGHEGHSPAMARSGHLRSLNPPLKGEADTLFHNISLPPAGH
jgi:hypothetical protein